jgi:hypothetical protein
MSGGHINERRYNTFDILEAQWIGRCRARLHEVMDRWIIWLPQCSIDNEEILSDVGSHLLLNQYIDGGGGGRDRTYLCIASIRVF